MYDRVDQAHLDGALGGGVAARVLAREPVREAVLRAVAGRQLTPVDDLHRRARAHDPDLGAGPRERGIGAEVLRVHRDVRAAERLAQDHGETWHLGAGERAEERCSVANDPAGLLADAGYEARRVDEHDERDT